MQYQIATPAMLPDCQKLVDETGYYSPVQLSDIGGMVVVGLKAERPVACIWVCLTGNRAYVDYLAVHPDHKGAGVRLLITGLAMLRRMGIAEIKYDVHQDNDEMFRMSSTFGADYGGFHAKYTMQIGVPDGREEG